MISKDCFTGVTKPTFFSFELAEWLRDELCVETQKKESVGALSYDRTYGDINILVEVLGGIYAVYMKDYSFGHIKPLGECVYILDDQLNSENSDAFFYAQILPDLTRRILSDEIKLEKELYDYYHNFPEGFIPCMESSVSDNISVSEAAAILGVSDSRIKKMLEDRVLDGFKINNSVRLSKADVEQRKAYIEKHGRPTRAEIEGKKNVSEIEFEAFLHTDPQINSPKAVATRVSRAREAERVLNISLDTVVASDDLTYDSLIALKQHENPRNAPLSNALRKYYLFRNGKEFPQLRYYRR